MNGTRSFLLGIFLACANAVPGLGISTMLLLLGMYASTLVFFGKIGISFVLLLRLRLSAIRELLAWRKLSFLALGFILGHWTVARLVYQGMIQHPLAVRSFAFGLMLGLISLHMHVLKSKRFIFFNLFLAGALIAHKATQYHLLESMDEGVSMAWSGFFLSSLALVPGLSGAGPLQTMWQFGPLHENLIQLKSHWISGAVTGWSPHLQYLLEFMGGFAVGSLLILTVFHFLFRHQRQLILAILLGMTLGSAHLLWPFRQINTYIHLGGSNLVVLSDRGYIPTANELQDFWPFLLWAVGFSLALLGRTQIPRIDAVGICPNHAVHDSLGRPMP